MKTTVPCQELNGLLTMYINIPTVSTRTIQCSNFFHISKPLIGQKLKLPKLVTFSLLLPALSCTHHSIKEKILTFYLKYELYVLI